jgi:hypothetical protein
VFDERKALFSGNERTGSPLVNLYAGPKQSLVVVKPNCFCIRKCPLNRGKSNKTMAKKLDGAIDEYAIGK